MNVFAPHGRFSRCRGRGRLGLLAVSVALLWAAPAGAVCIKRVAVTGSETLGNRAAWNGWLKWLHASLVVSGQEVGPNLPDDRCKGVNLSGKLVGKGRTWSFNGRIQGPTVETAIIVAKGSGWSDWYEASRDWVDLPGTTAVPVRDEVKVWGQLAQGDQKRQLENRRALADVVGQGATPAARLELALELQSLNPDFAQAEGLLKELAKDFPKSYGVQLALGAFCSLVADDACALKALKAAAALRPELLDAWAYLAAQAQAAGDAAGWLTYVRGAVKAEPKNAFFQYQLAAALGRNDQHKEALAALAKAVGQDASFYDQALTDPDLRGARRLPGFARLKP